MTQFEQRRKIIKQAVNLEIADRVPFVSNMSPWPAADSPYSFPEIYYNPTRITETWTALDKYHFDGHLVEFPSANSMGITLPLGNGASHIIEDRAINVKDSCLVEFDELNEYVADRHRFIWNVVLKRKFDGLDQGDLVGKFKESMLTMNKYMEARKETRRIFVEEQGVLLVGGYKDAKYVPGSGCPIEDLFHYARGMKNSSLDMRRNASRYQEILERYAENYLYKELEILEQSEYGTASDAMCDMYLGMLAHNMMNKKQFERFYWPHLNKLLTGLIDKGRVILLFAEGGLMRLAEYFQDFPKGHIILYSENDDIFQLRKAFPNCCVIGGMPTFLLGKGTAEECRDYTKKLIDGLAGDGGFILSTDKFMCTYADGTPENLSAVADTVLTYGCRR